MLQGARAIVGRESHLLLDENPRIVMCEAKTLQKMNRRDWQPTSQRQFMAVWEAEALISEFRDMHADAVIEQRYKLDYETIIELMASYADERADHRVLCQARER